MHLDVIDLNGFYSTGLGAFAQDAIAARVRQMWGDLKTERVVGLGYATPILDRLGPSVCDRAIAMMPAPQGVKGWPATGKRRVVLTDEVVLPLEDASVVRLLIVHGLEMSERVRPMLDEVWRVLAASGRVIIVVPNRRGLWARFETTPFGHGRPFTQPQLYGLMRDALFQPEQAAHCLFVPPVRWAPMLSAATGWERLGRRFWPSFSGVLMVEASKQVYALTGRKREARRVRRLIPVLPDPVPVPGRARHSTREQEDGLIGE